MNISVIQSNECTGCSACSNICPKNAICIEKDKYGFDVPVINADCNDCGLCYKKCPINHSIKNTEEQSVYAISIKNKNDRHRSSSGGAFFWIASHFIENGGVVYGAAMKPSGKVSHIRVDKKEDLVKLQSSKYVQSSIEDSYKSAKEDLKNRRVLFAGTPCQIAGLYAVVGSSDNLFTCDLLCFGVPSPLVFESYKREIVGQDDTDYISFRDKKYGWHRYSMSIKTKNQSYFADKNADKFLLGFQTHIFNRTSCYSCKFRGVERVGDITLGDFWDFKEKYEKNAIKDNDTGVSFVMLNNEKAKKLFDTLDKSLVFSEKRVLSENSRNWGFDKEMDCPPIRDEFFENVKKNGYISAISPYIKPKNYNKETSAIKKIYRKMKKFYYFRYMLKLLKKI